MLLKYSRVNLQDNRTRHRNLAKQCAIGLQDRGTQPYLAGFGCLEDKKDHIRKQKDQNSWTKDSPHRYTVKQGWKQKTVDLENKRSKARKLKADRIDKCWKQKEQISKHKAAEIKVKPKGCKKK